jgi:2-iminobutanoate/2-iminopropanoate deaminase
MPTTETRSILLPGARPPAAAYSPGVLCDGWLYVSGQGPIEPSSGNVVRGSIEDEVELTIRRIEAILRAAGAGLDHVVKCTCHLADIRDFDRFDRAYAAFFPGRKPARTTVQSVLWNGIRVEIDAIARLPAA